MSGTNQILLDAIVEGAKEHDSSVGNNTHDYFNDVRLLSIESHVRNFFAAKIRELMRVSDEEVRGALYQLWKNITGSRGGNL